MSYCKHLDVFNEETKEKHSNIKSLESIVFVFTDVHFFTRLSCELLVQNKCLDHLQDVDHGIVTEDLNHGREQIDTLVLDVAYLEDGLRLVVQEEVLVSNVLALVSLLDDHVAGDCHQEGEDALLDNFLDVWSLDEGGEELKELKCHTLDAVWFLLGVVVFGLVTKLVSFFFITVFVI
jgi:hypothetical protein